MKILYHGISSNLLETTQKICS